MLRNVLVLAGLALAAGASCSRSSGCSTSEYCADVSFSDTGTCTAKKSTGGSCTFSGMHYSFDDEDLQCATGLQCVSWKCKAPLADGASCTSGSACVSKFCDNHLPAISSSAGKCRSKVAIGGTCKDNSKSNQQQCTDGYCAGAVGADNDAGTSGTCTTAKSLGSACVYNVECAGLTPQCTNSKCADPLGSALGAAVAIGTTIIAVAIAVPVVICLCCCAVAFYLIQKKKKRDDD